MVIIASRYGGLITLESGILNFFYFLICKKHLIQVTKMRLRVVIDRDLTPGDHKCSRCIENLPDPARISGSG